MNKIILVSLIALSLIAVTFVSVLITAEENSDDFNNFLMTTANEDMRKLVMDLAIENSNLQIENVYLKALVLNYQSNWMPKGSCYHGGGSSKSVSESSPVSPVVEVTWNGDVNGDGIVNELDKVIMECNWGNSGQGDLNNDGIVDGSDLSIMLADWDGGEVDDAELSIVLANC